MQVLCGLVDDAPVSAAGKVPSFSSSSQCVHLSGLLSKTVPWKQLQEKQIRCLW